jgi:large subunit ribosomal protein L30
MAKQQKTLRITQRKSVIKALASQKATMRALGLRRIRHTVVHKDTPQIRGMITKVAHLVIVEEN